MDARYFYDMMMEYTFNNDKKHCYYGLCNRTVYIHHKGDESTYYVIFDSKEVMKHVNDKYDSKLMLSDLTGDDYELYNPVQIYKAGYIIITESCNTNDIKRVISELYDKVEETEGVTLCGGSFWDEGLTDSFSYYSSNGTELEIGMIKDLTKENVDRKYYGLRAIPFNKEIKNDDAFHVKFIHSTTEHGVDKYKKLADVALEELRQFLIDLEINFKWVETPIKKAVYC